MSRMWHHHTPVAVPKAALEQARLQPEGHAARAQLYLDSPSGLASAQPEHGGAPRQGRARARAQLALMSVRPRRMRSAKMPEAVMSGAAPGPCPPSVTRCVLNVTPRLNLIVNCQCW